MVSAVAVVTAANLGARLISSPRVTAWLAKSATKKSTPANFQKAMNELKAIAKKEPDIADDIAKYIGFIGALTTQIGEEE